jgi:hypothetical protein
MSKINRIPKAISSYGELVDIEAYSGGTYNDYGDLLVSTTSDYTGIKAIFNTVRLNNTENPEGDFQEADGVFYFKGDQLGVLINNVIIRADGSRYKISKANTHFYKGTTVVREAIVNNE